MRKSWRNAALIGSMSLTLALSACGGDSEPKDDSAGNKTFIAAYPAVATTLDPDTYEGDGSRWFGFERGGMLFVYGEPSETAPFCEQLPDQSHIRGELVETVEFQEDKNAYLMTLRTMKSEYGNDLTTADVAWTFDRLAELKGNASSNLASVGLPAKPIEVIDDRQFLFKVDKKSVIDLAPLTWESFAILDSTEAKKHATAADPWAKDWLSKNTAAFGPWHVTEDKFQPGVQVVLEKNPNYDLPRGNVDRVIFRAVDDPGTRLQSVVSGEVDFGARHSYDQVSRVKSDSKVQVSECVAADRDVVGLNGSDPALKSPQVRRAISLALDREAFTSAEGPYRGLAKPAVTGVSSVFPHADGVTAVEHDPAKARELLTEAGYPDGLDLALTYSPARPGPESEQIALLVQQQLAEANIRIKLNSIANSADFQAAQVDGKMQMWVNVLPPAQPDVAFDGGLYYRTKGIQNFFSFSEASVDGLLDQLLAEPIGAAREDLTRDLSNELSELVPFAPIAEKRFIRVVSSRVDNLINRPNGEIYVSNLTIK